MDKATVWMPFYWAEYLADTGHLTTEEHGAYLLLIGAYWQAGGPLTDDDKRLARLTRLSLRRWKAVRETLANFFTIADQKWHLTRVDDELSATKKRYLKRVEGGKKRQSLAGKKQQNQCQNASTADAMLQHSSSYVRGNPQSQPQLHDSDKSESEAPHSPPAVGDDPPAVAHLGHTRGAEPHNPDDVAQAVADWNRLADEVGLARVQLVSDRRKAAVRRRLAEAGGDDGWQAALEKIRESPGLRGENERGWTASFDWAINQANFTKLMEGNYDNWSSDRPARGGAGKAPSTGAEGFARAAAEIAAQMEQKSKRYTH